MRRYFGWMVMIFALLTASAFYSEAQTPLKMRLMTETGDMITTNEPAIKSYYMGGDGTLSIVLQDPLTFGLTDPPISIGTGTNCTIPGDGSVRATEGSTFSFNVYSTEAGATLSAPVRPYNGTGVQATFNNGNLQWSTVSGDTGTYLAVFQAVNGAKTSQIVVMIKIGAAETITVPTTISGPSTGSVNVSYSFTVSGSTSSLSHAVEYQFDWGDGGPLSLWSTSQQSHTYAAANTYNVKAKARCISDHVESGWSSSHSITISNVPTYTLTLAGGPGGSAANITAAGLGPYPAGAQVTIQATPSAGYAFSGWSGGATGTTNPLTFNMPSANVTVTANFTSTSQKYTLTVSPYPFKFGSVTLSPPGGSYPAGTRVTITATPTVTHSFAGWSGDGTGTITGTINPITITMPSSNVTATANF